VGALRLPWTPSNPQTALSTERSSDEHNCSRPSPFSLILLTSKRLIIDVYESALCPFIASRSQNPHSGSTWRMWWSTGSNRVNVVELVISIVACRLQVQIWCSFRCVLASFLRRKEAINGCSTQGRSVLRTAIPTPCLGFSAISKSLQHIAWYSSFFDPDELRHVTPREANWMLRVSSSSLITADF